MHYFIISNFTGMARLISRQLFRVNSIPTPYVAECIRLYTDYWRGPLHEGGWKIKTYLKTNAFG